MPCRGPSQAELDVMQLADNERIFGVRDTLLNITTRVACDLAHGRSNDLTRRWTKWHQEEDRKREAEEARAKKEKAAQKEIDKEARRIRAKHGL